MKIIHDKYKNYELVSYSPIDGRPLARIIQAKKDDSEIVIETAQKRFERFRMMPAPKGAKSFEKSEMP